MQGAREILLKERGMHHLDPGNLESLALITGLLNHYFLTFAERLVSVKSELEFSVAKVCDGPFLIGIATIGKYLPKSHVCH